VIEVSSEVVFARLVARDGLQTIERTFIWKTEVEGEVVVRRTLIDADGGEVLDEVWLDEEGRVRSWSCVPTERSDTPDGSDSRGIESIVASSARADHGVIEDGGDDRVLASQREGGPGVP
jgi:hypothetical protein